MELLLLDKNFEICGLIDEYSSLVWNRNYYSCGNFKLQIGIDYWKQFNNAVYVYCKDFEETGIIETLNYKTTDTGTIIERSGRFLESILESRVINKTQTFKNTITEDIIRNLITTFCINSGTRKIPKLTLGTRKGLGTSRTLQVTGKNLLEYIYQLCKEDELGIKLKYDFDNDELVFEVYQGLNRSDSQNVNTWAIFSRNFENIIEDSYSTDETQYFNFAYVAGEDSGSSRVVVEVNRIQTGEDRKELYVDARDLQSEVYDDEGTATTIPLAEYKQMLTQRGIEKLNECKKVEQAEFNIDPYSNLIYKTDFDLGDKVVYKNNDLNFNIEKRIVGITESYEDGNKTIDITFGEDYNIKKVKEMI